MLTNRYLNGIPEGSRATLGHFLKKDQITEPLVKKVKALNAMAEARGQTMAQMAIAWVLSHKQVTSALIGASRPAQIEDAVGALGNAKLGKAELAMISQDPGGLKELSATQSPHPSSWTSHHRRATRPG